MIHPSCGLYRERKKKDCWQTKQRGHHNHTSCSHNQKDAAELSSTYPDCPCSWTVDMLKKHLRSHLGSQVMAQKTNVLDYKRYLASTSKKIYSHPRCGGWFWIPGFISEQDQFLSPAYDTWLCRHESQQRDRGCRTHPTAGQLRSTKTLWVTFTTSPIISELEYSSVNFTYPSHSYIRKPPRVRCAVKIPYCQHDSYIPERGFIMLEFII